jgi:hypothetical protein
VIDGEKPRSTVENVLVQKFGWEARTVEKNKKNPKGHGKDQD